MKITKFLEASPLFAIYQTSERVLRPFEEQLRFEQLTFIQSMILTALYFEEKPVSPSSMASVFKTSPSNISHSLKHLDSNGWLVRVIDIDDSRRKNIHLTTAGKKKVIRLIKVYDELQNYFESVLSERRTLRWNMDARELVEAFTKNSTLHQ